MAMSHRTTSFNTFLPFAFALFLGCRARSGVTDFSPQVRRFGLLVRGIGRAPLNCVEPTLEHRMQRRRADDPRFRLCKRRRIEHEWLRLRSAEPTMAPDQFFEGGDFAGGRIK